MVVVVVVLADEEATVGHARTIRWTLLTGLVSITVLAVYRTFLAVLSILQ